MSNAFCEGCDGPLMVTRRQAWWVALAQASLLCRLPPGPEVHRSQTMAMPTAVTSGTSAKSIMYATVVSPFQLIG